MRPQLKRFTVEKAKSRVRPSGHLGAFGLRFRPPVPEVVAPPVLTDRIIGTIHASRAARAVENKGSAG